ncbi:MAG: response regulator transcription factor [Magnetococcales bacterium]|nr:response regulator transcription factor [Magnetococcales bacterium]
MIRVFLIDDHEVLREGLKKILSRQHDILVVGEAGSGREAVRALRSLEVDVIILDITLPDSDGLEVLNRILGLKQDVSVLVYTMHEEIPLAIPFLKAGAKGFLSKVAPSKTLIEGIRQVYKKKKFLTPQVGEALLQSWQQGETPLTHSALSNREFTVFRLLASGKMVTEIATELGVTKSTVSTHRRNILEKMGLKSTSSLMRYAIEHKLI